MKFVLLLIAIAHAFYDTVSYSIYINNYILSIFTTMKKELLKITPLLIGNGVFEKIKDQRLFPQWVKVIVTLLKIKCTFKSVISAQLFHGDGDERPQQNLMHSQMAFPACSFLCLRF